MPCDGPDGTAWSNALNACVDVSSQTSCSASTGQTCFYAFLTDGGDKASWFSGQFMLGRGLKIGEPDLLANLGISSGDWVNKINDVLLTDEATLLAELAPFTETAPASVFSTTHLLGKYQLSLSH